MLTFLNFNPHIAMMASTLRDFANEMRVFQVSILIIFFSYLCFAELTLRSLSEDFSTVFAAVQALFAMSLGILRYNAIFPTHEPSVAALFFISFSSFVVFVIIIMIVSIINKSYATVRADPSTYSYDKELNKHLSRKVRSWWNNLLNRSPLPKEKEEKSTLGKMTVFIVLSCILLSLDLKRWYL